MKKTNKTFKRFAAITSASLLAACAVAPAITIAAEQEITSGSITIKTEETDHNYSAYQVFDGDLSKDTETGAITFSNIKWGNGIVTSIPNPDYIDATTTPDEPETLSLYDALMNLDEAFSKNGAPFTKAEEVAGVLQSEYSGSAGTTALFADIDKVAAVFAQFKGTAAKTVSDITETDVDPNTDGTQKGYVFSALDPGYYFVEEIEADNDDKLAEGEAKTKYLLQVAGDALVSPKADAPKVMKKVLEDSKLADTNTNGDTVSFAGKNYQLADGYNDVADYNIGDDIHFTLYGSLPTSFDNYQDYYYKFTDTMGAGLDLVNLNGTGLGEDDFTVEITDYNVDGTAKEPVELTEDQFVLSIAADNSETVDVNEKGFTIEIPNLKQIDMDKNTAGTQVMSSKAIITVKYAAELNANAVIGNNGNPNDVYLTYSNNSNTAQGGSTDETGDTAKDYNVVFTYELDVTKKLGETGLANDVTGTKAGFRLYNADKKKVATFDSANKFTGWVDSNVVDEYETAGNEIFTTADGTFNFIGLQDGTYYLTETTVPTGYNRMEDKMVVIAADTSNAAAGTCQNYIETLEVGKALTKLEITVDGETKAGNIADGTVAMSITNNKGNELPGTGGIGTTIFYLGGGAMAAIGGVYLISKRRMKKSEE